MVKAGKIAEAAALARQVEAGELLMDRGRYAEAEKTFSAALALPGGELVQKLLSDAKTPEAERKRREKAKLEANRRGQAGTASGIEPRSGRVYPLVPVRNSDILPGQAVTLSIGRPLSVEAVWEAPQYGDRIFLAQQNDAKTQAPRREDLRELGTLARVVSVRQVKAGEYEVQVLGLARMRLNSLSGILAGVEEPGGAAEPRR